MKTVITTLALCTALIFSASAQETRTKAKTHPKTEKRTQEPKATEERMQERESTERRTQQADPQVQRHVERMSNELNLNEDQKKRLEAHYTSVSREQHRSQPVRESDKDRVKINEKTEARYNSEIRDILNDEQYEKYLSNKDSYKWNQDNTRGMTPNESMTPTNNKGSKEQPKKGGGQHGTQPNPEK